MKHKIILPTIVAFTLAFVPVKARAQTDAPIEIASGRTAFATPVTADNLDEAAWKQWIDGTEQAALKNMFGTEIPTGARHVIWTQGTRPDWTGVKFGDSKNSGVRHLRIGFKTPIAVGSLLVRGIVQPSVLKPGVDYPGDLNDDSQWIKARRLKRETRGEAVSGVESDAEEYPVWVLPPNTRTRALRFTHTSAPTDASYVGVLSSVLVLTERVANVAPQAQVWTSANEDKAALLNNNSNDGTWGAWDNGPEGAAQTVSPLKPETVVLTWPKAVSLRGMSTLWTGFGAAQVQTYAGKAGGDPRAATDADWKTLKNYEGLQSGYFQPIWSNWMDFGKNISTRAIRLVLTAPTQENHPHLNGNTKGGKRVWLGEVMALSPLGAAELQTAILPRMSTPIAPHAPIPIRFTLPFDGYVSLVIEDASGKRVRNLVSETPFPKGPNVAWWDGMDDLGRDTEAARHGLYHVPGTFVAPGAYRARGLYRKALDLRYEFSVYNAGTPSWETQDGTGGWLTNHTPSSSTLFVPANAQDPKSKPQVLLGSAVSEGGAGLAGVDLNGRKQWGRGWIGGNWTAAPFLAGDAGAGAMPNAYAYVGAAWEGELRLTALTPNGDQAVLSPTYKFPGATEQEKKDASALGGFAIHNGLLAATLPKQNQLLLIDAALHRQRALVALPDGRGVAFDKSGRMLALSGKRLLRYALPAALAPAVRLDTTNWMATASTHAEDAGKAFDADANSRWSTNETQAPGQSFSVDMKSPQAFSTIVLTTQADRDSPKSWELATSGDGQNWKTIATGEGKPTNTTITVPRTTARHFKITQTGTTTDSYFSINSIAAFDAAPIVAATTLSAPQVLTTDLEDPQSITLDDAGNIYVSDRGLSHQVKVFDSSGKLRRKVGHAGAPQAGPYDALHMNNPKGITVDANNRLWVSEEDYKPKRVSVWNPDGTFWKAFYGPAQYGGGGTLDSRDKTRFYYTGMEFKLDWKTGENHPANIIFRPGPNDLQLPDGYGTNGEPETPLYAQGRQYMTNCFNSNPTNGSSIAMLWLMRDNIARPVAAMGRANDWSVLKGDAFKARLPEGIDLKGDYWQNQALFAWSDANGDAQMQPAEVTIQKKSGVGSVTVMPDLSFVVSRVSGKAMRFASQKFTAAGVPIYDIDKGETLVEGAQEPVTSGGDQALVSSDGWTILTNAPQPFSPYGIGGVKGGKVLWSYPSLWPGLHASHEAPVADHPGQLLGTTRLIGGFVTPRAAPGSAQAGEAGPLWAINGNMGNMYLFTSDGLFVAQMFQDVRGGKLWTMPVAERNMKVNDVSLHDENFWPTMTQTDDGQIYLNSSQPNIVRIDGLESIRRLNAIPVMVTKDDLKRAQTYLLEGEAQRQKEQGTSVLQVALNALAPVVDGKLDEWALSDWASIDKRGTAANFDSNSKPYNVSGALRVVGDRLYAAWKTNDPDLLRNSGEVQNAPFKTGGALDLMLGAVDGGERLLVTRVKDKTLAVLYRPRVAGTKTPPIPFSSPSRTFNFDRVDDVSSQVTLAGEAGNYEISVPLALLGLKPQSGQSIKGDIGILRGNGTQTFQRVYWRNKATGITSDVPSEAELLPQLWGEWRFVNTP